MNPFVAQLMLVPYNFAPLGWVFCQGQLLPISQFTAVFSLVGTFYGGDGKSNFALPNLQGCVAMGQGQGPGLNLYDIGETGGSDTVTLLTSEMPQHSHATMGVAQHANQASPGSSALSDALNAGGSPISLYATGTPNVAMSPSAISPAGGSQPHNNMMPFVTLNWVIALQGVYPPRS
jgi:microcystin-dependent protein